MDNRDETKEVNNAGEEEQDGNGIKENWLILVGALIAIIAVVIPFLLICLFEKKYNLADISSLGQVGDFFGGTTVGLLSLASIVFVTAAIVMQKEELRLQRREVEKSREEYHLTNKTLKKQQFDSTFFNMLNLHHSITNDLEVEGTEGRAVMDVFLNQLLKIYNTDVYEEYTNKLKNEALLANDEEYKKLIWYSFFDYWKTKFIIHNEPEPIYVVIDDEAPYLDHSNIEGFHEEMEEGYNKEWNEEKENIKKRFMEEIYPNDDKCPHWLDAVDFKDLYPKYSCFYLNKFSEEFIAEPLNELKTAAFENTYKRYENQLGHYFRNLYRIVLLIQEEKFFDNNEKENLEEQRKYRGILRAQLSTKELQVIFYNIVYSTKGEKFRKLLVNTHFFDDHLSENDFLWVNDTLELQKLDLS